MLQYARIMSHVLVKRTRNCSWITVQHLLSFSSTTTSNVLATKDEDSELEVLSKNNLDYKIIKPKEFFLDYMSKSNSINESKFNNLIEELKKLQCLKNKTDVTFDDFLKNQDEILKKISSYLKTCNSKDLNMLMSNFNMKKMNNLLVEDNISEELVIAVLKQFNANESIHFLIKLTSEQLRPTAMLQTLANNIINSKINMELSAGVLYAMASLNFYNDDLLQYTINNIINNISKCHDTFIFGSIVKSLGILRIKNEILLTTLSLWILNNKQIVTQEEIRNFLITLAVLRCPTENFDSILQDLVMPMKELNVYSKFIWLDIVWALTVLDKACLNLHESILNVDFIKDLFDESNIIIPKGIKVLNINGAALLNRPYYKGPILKEDCSLFTIPIKFRKQKISLSASIIKALKLLLPGDKKFLNTDVNTRMGFLIDAEFCVDNKLTPHPVTLNLEKKINRIAVMSVDYHELCYGSNEITGPILFYSKLLEKQGYKVLLLSYSEMFTKFSSLERAKYIINQLKLLLNK